MLPLVLQSSALKIGLAGEGEGLTRRQAFLSKAEVRPTAIPTDASEFVLKGLKILFVTGLSHEAAKGLADRARAAGVLVNVEDMPDLCDFHVPAAVRRGDLLLTVSTGGRAPGLARILREWLAERFGDEWESRIDDIGRSRQDWRAAGNDPAEVSRKTRELIAQKGWLQ